MRRGLRAIHQHHGARRVRLGDHFLDRIDRAERVRDMAHGQDLGALRQQCRKLILLELTGIVDRHHFDDGAGLRGDQLPRHDVRVVLEPGQQDLIAGLQCGAAVTLRHQVDAVGGPLGQHDRAHVGRVEERRRLGSAAFIERGGAFAQQVRRAMNIGVGVAVVIVHRLQHGFGLLAGVGAIEVDQRLAVHALGEDREVGPNLRDVERRLPAEALAKVGRDAAGPVRHQRPFPPCWP